MNDKTIAEIRDESKRLELMIAGWGNAIEQVPPEEVWEYARVVALRGDWMEKLGLLELDLLGEELKNGR